MGFSSESEEKMFKKIRYAFRLFFGAVIGALVGYLINGISNIDLSCSENSSGACAGIIWAILVPLAIIISIFTPSTSNGSSYLSQVKLSSPWGHYLNNYFSVSTSSTIGAMINCAIIGLIWTYFKARREENKMRKIDAKG